MVYDPAVRAGEMPMFSRKKAEQEAAAAHLGGVAFFEGFTPDELARVAELAD